MASTAVFRAVADFGSVISQANQVKGALGGVSGQVGGMGEQIGGLGRSLSFGVTLPLVALGGAAVKSFGDFQTAIVSAGIKTGATSAEIEKMTEISKKWAGQTRFSSVEVAGALDLLGARGLSAQQSMDALPAALQAAQASGSDLATTTAVVASAINSFSLNATDATHVADVMANAANTSALSMDGLALSLADAGQLGALTGASLEEVVAGIARITDMGVPAAQAGTAFRQAIVSLASPTTVKAANLMKNLGLVTRDTHGNFLPLTEVVHNLDETMSDANPKFVEYAKSQGLSSKAARDQAMNVLFGVEGMKAMNLLLSDGKPLMLDAAKDADKLGQLHKGLAAIMGKDEAEAWIKAHTQMGVFTAKGDDAFLAMTALGTASDGLGKKAADLFQATTQQKIDNFLNSVQNLGITLVGSVAPALNLIVDGLTVFFGWLEKIGKIPGFGPVIVTALVLAAALGPVLWILSQIIESWRTVRSLGKAGIPIPGAGGKGTTAGAGLGGRTAVYWTSPMPVYITNPGAGGVTGAAGETVVGGAGGAEPRPTARPSRLSRIGGALRTGAKGAAGGALLGAGIGAVTGLASGESAGDVAKDAAGYGAMGAAMGVAEKAATGLFGVLRGPGATALAGTAEAVGGAAGRTGVMAALRGLSGFLFTTPWGIAIGAIGTAAYLVWDNWDTISPWLHDRWNDISGWAQDTFGEGGSMEVVGDAWNGLQTAWSTAWDGVSTWWGDTWTSLQTKAEENGGGLVGWTAAIFDETGSQWSKAWDTVTTVFDGVWDPIQKKAEEKGGGVTGYVGALWDGTQTGWTAAWDGVQSWWSTNFDGLQTIADTKGGGVSGFVGALWDGVQVSWPNTWSTIQSWFGGALGGVDDAAHSQLGGTESFARTLWDSMSFVWPGKWDAIGDSLGVIWDGMKARVTAVFEGVKTELFGGTDATGVEQESLWQRTRTALGVVWDGITGDADSKFGATATAAGTQSAAGGAAAVGSWSSTHATVSGIWGQMQARAEGAWSAITTAVSTRVTAMRTGIQSGLSQVSALWSAGWNALPGIVSGVFSRVLGIVTGAVGSIIAGVKKITSTLGGIASAAGSAVRSIIPGMSTGGFVTGGEEGKDSVLRRLMPDEFVVTRKGVDAIGEDVLLAANAGTLDRGQLLGGVPGRIVRPVQVLPEAAAPVQPVAAAATAPGGDVRLTVINPRPERASTTIHRQMQTLAAHGVIRLAETTETVR